MVVQRREKVFQIDYVLQNIPRTLYGTVCPIEHIKRCGSDRYDVRIRNTNNKCIGAGMDVPIGTAQVVLVSFQIDDVDHVYIYYLRKRLIDYFLHI